MPADPGSAGEASIEGVDADQDGLRDDVQRWVSAHASIASHRSALFQLARALVGTLSVTSKQAALQQAERVVRAQECVFARLPRQAEALSADLEALVVNTRARGEAYLAYNERLAGESFPFRARDDWLSSCEGGRPPADA